MRVVHIFNVDFDKLKVGDRYDSYCGRGYIADEPPTKEESDIIASEWIRVPVCKKCQKMKKRQESK